MIDSRLISPAGQLLSEDQVLETLQQALSGKLNRQRVLVLIPDHTRSLPLPFLFRALVDVLHEVKQLDFMVALVTEYGQPVDFFLTPGSWSDTRALKLYHFDLPEGSLLTGDKAYNDYAFGDLLEEAQLALQPLRKHNSRRPVPPWIQYLLACYRKIIETTGSLLEQLLPKHIHAVTLQGFELKLALFVLATSFHFFNMAT